MLRLAFKAVKHNPKRLILTTVAVVLGVAFVTTIHIFTNTIDRQFSEMIDDIYTGSDITVAEAGEIQFDASQLEPFPQSVFDDVQAVPGVEEAYEQISAVLVLLDSDGELPTQTGAPNIFFNWVDNEDIGRMTILEGRAPEYSGEAAIDKNGMERLGYEIGDTLNVVTDGGLASYLIVGESWFGETNDLSGAILVQLTLEDIQELTGFEGQIQSIALTVSDGYDIDEVAQAIDEVLPAGVEAQSNAQIIEDQQEGVREGLKVVDIFTLVFALISVFVGGFIIANTFRIIVTQRTREIGLVRALGARGSQVRGQILIEALIVAVTASIIGIGLGYLFAFGLTTIVDSSDSGLVLGTPRLPLDAVVWGLSVGIFVTVVSAILPAIHASQISPMEALREAATHHRKPLRLRNAIGCGLVVASVAGIVLGLCTSVPLPGLWVGASAALLVFGAALLSAQILTWLASHLRKILGAVFGINGRLAAGNIKREPRRAGITSTALMIGVLLLALVATFTESAKASIREQVEDQVACDLIVSSGVLSAEFVDVSDTAVEAIESTAGVDLVSTIQVGEGTVDGEQMIFGAVDPATADEVYHFPTTPGVENLGNGVFITISVQDLGYEVGDTITVVGDDGTRDLEITGTYDAAENWDFLVSADTAATLDDEMVAVMALVNITPGADITTVQVAVEDSLDEFPLFDVQRPDQAVQAANDAMDSLLVFITIMLAASLIIAILGVANTLFLSVTERTREIGLIRAVGARRSSVWSMITLESVIIAVFGAVLGVVLGVGLGAALVTALGDYGLGTAVIPWFWLLIYTVMATLAGIIAALIPAALAANLDILEAVTTE